ncbi:hypothetical protein [Mucilaginibacter myungsuensis]|uniref:Uncharacterized protein n=1 Tax=Mucilaginibacter myungsuensis TaxID=649104 RepID=A0A929KYT7_9SPHI|nr:hypothetical protein [Mucilaginibacter myungsuensis]MBE9664194.1 hypothetical protein [Mucilaginibacter myungsuensis]MDN3599896.1 hypothetical protein [Mucilaginibacter myungsuensis]
MKKLTHFKTVSATIAIVSSLVLSTASAQTTDSLRKAAAAAKGDTAMVMRHAIDGVLVSKEVFDARKDGLIGLIAYPGKIFDPQYKGYVAMKVSEKNENSPAVLKLKARADSLGLKSHRMERRQ